MGASESCNEGRCFWHEVGAALRTLNETVSFTSFTSFTSITSIDEDTVRCAGRLGLPRRGNVLGDGRGGRRLGFGRLGESASGGRTATSLTAVRSHPIVPRFLG